MKKKGGGGVESPRRHRNGQKQNYDKNQIYKPRANISKEYSV